MLTLICKWPTKSLKWFWVIERITFAFPTTKFNFHFHIRRLTSGSETDPCLTYFFLFQHSKWAEHLVFLSFFGSLLDNNNNLKMVNNSGKQEIPMPQKSCVQKCHNAASWLTTKWVEVGGRPEKRRGGIKKPHSSQNNNAMGVARLETWPTLHCKVICHSFLWLYFLV